MGSKKSREPRLFTPLTIRGVTFSHRLWVSPMCQYSARDGLVQPWHHVHLGSFAVGRAALVMTEAAAVSPVGRISPRDAGIWTSAQADAWRPIVDFIHSQGSQAGIQLAHAGRKASTRSPGEGRGYVEPGEGGWVTIGPSPIAYGSLPVPVAMSQAAIAGVIAEFVAAARRSVDAGFDVVEIHAAHGYLIHEFLSPLANRRTDEYGGSFENRARLLLEITGRVREVIPDGMPLFVRISATDWIEGGWSEEGAARLAPEVAAHGADLIDVSSGGLDRGQQISVGPGYQVPLARSVRGRSPVPVGAVGLISSGAQAESLLVDGAADAIFAGREFLRDSNFTLRAAAELGALLPWPPQYAMAKFAGSIP